MIATPDGLGARKMMVVNALSWGEGGSVRGTGRAVIGAGPQHVTLSSNRESAREVRTTSSRYFCLVPGAFAVDVRSQFSADRQSRSGAGDAGARSPADTFRSDGSGRGSRPPHDPASLG